MPFRNTLILSVFHTSRSRDLLPPFQDKLSLYIRELTQDPSVRDFLQLLTVTNNIDG